jgi:hypothetical protein
MRGRLYRINQVHAKVIANQAGLISSSQPDGQ